MRLFIIAAVLIFSMPITGSGWAEGSNVLLDPQLMCKKTRRLRGKMAEICRPDSGMLKEIINGINLGFRECEFQFKNRRWNCTALRKSMRKILMKDTRETSFVNAITAAGVTFAVTRACTMGNLVECSCDKNHPRRGYNNVNDKPNPIDSYGGNTIDNRINSNDRIPTIDTDITGNSNLGNVGNVGIENSRPGNIFSDGQYIENRRSKKRRRNKSEMRRSRKKGGNRTSKNRKFTKNIILPGGEWEWGGCGDNVNFGFRKSRAFLDARYRRRSDIKTLVKLHNNNAGRMAVRDFMRLECKCHGLSGSCTMKTCWLKMPSFREVGIRLKERFDGAAKVIAHNDGTSFVPEGATIKPPSKYDLIYTDESPDFCRPNHRTGSLGTTGRECNSTSQGVDGCDLLCCNRGYDRHTVKEKVNCNCVFKWCCEVTCATCIEKRELNTCR